MKNQFVILHFVAKTLLSDIPVNDYVIIPKFKFDEMEHKDRQLYIMEDTNYIEVEETDMYIIDMSTHSLLLGLGLGR